MKTSKYIIALSVLAAVISCNKAVEPELPAPGDLVTITAVLPDDADAEVKGGGVKTVLSWTWNAGDKITVIGETTEIFKIKEGFTPKKAEFVGMAVKGSKFTILYPGGESEDIDFNEQVQRGNNNLDHLQYIAALQDVDAYTSFSFNQDWAQEHGGTLSQSGVLKLTLDLPAEITQLDSVVVSADSDLFFAGNSAESASSKIRLNFQDCTVDDGTLVAWFNTSCNEAAVAAGSTLYITVYSAGKSMSRDALFSKDAVLKAGVVNLFTLSGSGWSDDSVNEHYAGGKGTKALPWIIQTKEQLFSLAGDLADGSVRCCKLDADIDLTGETWVPLNNEEPYRRYVEFDGANHTISNLSAPLFNVLSGSVKDLVIEGAAIEGGSAVSGILANTILLDYDNVISNVDIKNSSVTAANTAGALFGQSDARVAISGCDVVSTDVTGTIAGGLLAFANNVITASGCSVTGGTVTASARYAGGLMASVASYENSVIENCSVKDNAVKSAKDRVGGVFGQVAQLVSVKNCVAGNVDVIGSQNVGGFFGVCYGIVSGCTSSGVVTSTNTNTGNYAANLGGFAGYSQYGTISACSASVVIDAKGANMGGFVGNMQSGTIEKCCATGNVTGTYRYIGGFAGIIDAANPHVINNCYCTGEVSGNSYVGGFIGGYNNGQVEVANCYASGNVTASGFAAGGLIGHVKLAGCKAEKNAAWNAKVTATTIGAGSWSSACVVGVAFPLCTLTDNYRNPAMELTAYWVPEAGYQHANVSAETPLVKQDGTATTATGIASGQDGYPQFPYHGKVEADKTLSQLASTTLGWSADVWDFSAELPKLK
ncbi:MAG: hypothetical protein J5764_00040 [Bacteroidales bacterium]|nr:hypothetical protein [Bacteroidales bacterium]